MGDLAVHLAGGGKHESSLTVLRAALEVIPDPRPVSEELKALDPEYQHEARTRLASYECQWILQRNGSELLELLGASLVELLSVLLERALSFEHKFTKGTEVVEDYSYIWRPSLSGGETADYPKRFLVPAVVHYADMFASQGSEQLKSVQKILAARRFKVFKRIELDLLRRHLELAGIPAVAQYLVDKDAFEDVGLRFEYDALSARALGLLDAPQREQILRWIEEGLNRERLMERGFSQTEADDAVDYWRLERLGPIKELLDADWRKRYDSLHEKFGDPPDRRRTRGGAYQLSSRSPKPSEELETLPVPNLIESENAGLPVVLTLRGWVGKSGNRRKGRESKN